MNDRNRFTPITLTVERPVLHLVLDTLFADTLACEEFEHLCDRFLLGFDAVEEFGVDHFAVARVSSFFDVAALDDFDDVDAELLCKVVVAFVMCGNCHDRAGTVTHHDVVGDEDRDFLAVCGVDRGQTFDADTGLVLDKLGTLKFGLLCAFFLVCVQRVDVGDLCRILFDDRMLGRDDHESNAEHRVGTGGIDTQVIVGTADGEVCKCAFGTADPVFLLELDVGQIVYFIQTEQQLVCIFGDAQIPDVLGLLNDIGMADIALTALGVFVGKNDLTGGAVVDERGCTEDQTFVEHLAEDPLGPLVVALFGGIDNAGPVEGEADALQLRSEVCDVGIGDHTGMGVGFDGIVFRRQTVCVKADGEQNVVTLHAALSGNDFQAGVSLDVTDVHTCTGGIREFDQTVELLLGMVLGCVEDTGVFPLVLPLFLNIQKIVFHVKVLSDLLFQ